MSIPHGKSLLLLLGLLCLSGCGERTPDDDDKCDADKPHAYAKPPLISSCSEIRTSEGRTDPKTGKIERFHRFFHCCH